MDDVFDNLDDILKDNLDDKFKSLFSQYLESFIIIGRVFLLLNVAINPFLYVFSCQHYRLQKGNDHDGKSINFFVEADVWRLADHEQSAQMSEKVHWLQLDQIRDHGKYTYIIQFVTVIENVR